MSDSFPMTKAVRGKLGNGMTTHMHVIYIYVGHYICPMCVYIYLYIYIYNRCISSE